MKVEIDVDVLSRDINSLQTLSRNLQKKLTELGESMEVLNQSWEGTAKKEYLQRYKEDKEYMQQMCDTLTQFVNTLEYAKEEYHKCEANVKEIVAKIQI